MGKNRLSICIVGWYYWSEFYNFLKRISKKYDVFVIAHRHNEILDRLKLKYKVVKNVGLEFGAYSWFMENVWDGKSSVIFMQDDVIIKEDKVIGKLFKKSRESGLDFIKWGYDRKKSPGGRCIFCSRKILRFIKKEFKKLSFDNLNFGFLYGDLAFYDPIYRTEYRSSSFNHSSSKFVKAGITYGTLYQETGIVFCRKGTASTCKKKLLRGIPYMLSDNSVFNIKIENKMNILAKKICPERSSNGYDGKGYAKWYDFCFQNIKNEKLDILEFAIKNKESLELWERYFINSHIIGVKQDDNIEEIISTAENGLDIIIDNGLIDDDRIKIFEYAFGKLNPGGIYIFENLRQGYGGGKSPVIEYLKEKMDAVNLHGRDTYPNYEQFVYNENEDMGFYEKRISAIYLYFDVGIVFKHYCR